MKINITNEEKLLKAADDLLYRVLWQPLGLPRNTRDKFPVEGELLTFVALAEERVIGSIILIYREGLPLEIRHLAVEEAYRGQNTGKSLVNEAITFAARNKGTREVYVYGRDTAAEFYRKLGFSGQENAEISEFSKAGVRFIRFTKIIN